LNGFKFETCTSNLVKKGPFGYCGQWSERYVLIVGEGIVNTSFKYAMEIVLYAWAWRLCEDGLCTPKNWGALEHRSP